MDKKKIISEVVPAVITYGIGNQLSCIWRNANGDILTVMDKLADLDFSLIPSFATVDIAVGLATAGAVRLLRYIKSLDKKNFKRMGEEYGSARWGTADDIKPYMAKKFEDNIILTRTERLTMTKPSAWKYNRNKNVMVIGGSGSSKTRGFGKPNVMQMNSSYVYTDPKGTVLVECGKMLLKGRPTGKKDKQGNEIYEPYKVKVFNTIDFSKSMHYNPFAYISERHCEVDILKFVNVLMANTNGTKPEGTGDFWEKAEKMLYMAYIAMIFCLSPENERNIETLIEMISLSKPSEDDEDYKNAIDYQFEAVEKWVNGTFSDEDDFFDFNELRNYTPTKQQLRLGKFACRQYAGYKLAAGKTAKSILISCSARLSPFAIDEVLEITSYDELQIDKLGDELSALFVIISDTDDTFNFLVAIMYSQMFNLLCTKADNNPGGKLKYHVSCILDEFKNIGRIPNFDKLIATIRSREISAKIILQTKSQLKDMYKENADTIEGNCDTVLFLGGKEKTTLKDISESLGKETIDLFNTSQNKGSGESYGTNYQKQGRELKTADELEVMDNDKCILQIRGVRPFFSDKYQIETHPMYKRLADYDYEKNALDIAAYVSSIKHNRLIMHPKQIFDTYQVS